MAGAGCAACRAGTSGLRVPGRRGAFRSGPRAGRACPGSHTTRSRAATPSFTSHEAPSQTSGTRCPYLHTQGRNRAGKPLCQTSEIPGDQFVNWPQSTSRYECRKFLCRFFQGSVSKSERREVQRAEHYERDRGMSSNKKAMSQGHYPNDKKQAAPRNTEPAQAASGEDPRTRPHHIGKSSSEPSGREAADLWP